MICRLNINGVDVGFDTSLPISINKSVADIREPGKRNSGYSKTIRIPGTPEANKLFEFIFEINVESNNFNPNVKTPASYFVNEIEVFKGDLQLLEIEKEYVGLQQKVYYDCSIIAENGNLFLDIAGLYLTDIDLSDLDHPFTYATGLFNPSLGTGYCYPYIDYGVSTSGNRVSDEWTFEHLKPAVFEREYVSRIFSAAGYTWEASGFFDTDYYKHIIIPDVNAGALQLSVSSVQDNQFLSQTSGVNTNTQSLTYTGSNHWTLLTWSEAMAFDDDSSTGYYDTGGVYDTATFIFSPTIDGTFSITATCEIGFDVNMPAGAITAEGSYDIAMQIQKSTNGGGAWSNVGVFYTESVVANTGYSAPYSGTATLPPTLVTLPAIYRVVIGVGNVSFLFRNALSNPVTAGSASIDFNYNGTFGAVLATANLPSGATVVMNDTIPRDITQIDFLTSIIKAENLYIEPDRDNPRKYIIEPRENFIQETNPLDWSDKLDTSKPIKITPMGELDVKRYIFTYKSDKDFYNKLYEDEFKEVYGTETIDVETDFVKGEKKIELIFSATPSASPADVTTSGGLDQVVPRLFSMDESGGVSPLRCNIRRLYWGGLIDCTYHYLITTGYRIDSSNLTSGSSRIRVAQYPYAGHLDHPIDPTIDLNFDNPLRIYWLFPNQTFTNNDRYGARYSKFISEITDRDSKIVTAYFYLTERDIYEFSFRKQIFFDGVYYFVNEIKDYDPQEEKSIPVELLKLQTGPTFTPLSLININDQLGGGGDMSNARTGPNMNMRGNYGAGKSYGNNNINNDPSSLVIGNNNNIQ